MPTTSRPAHAHAIALALALAIALAALGGCSGGSDASEVLNLDQRDPPTAGLGAAPEISLLSSLDAESAEFAIAIDVSDPDDDLADVAWRLVDGPASAALIASDTDGAAIITVPRNGSYLFAVIAMDRAGHRTERQVEVTVDAPVAFTVDGSLSDDGTPTSSARIDLLWFPHGEDLRIATANSDATGAVSYDDLIGSPTHFGLAFR
jgi:hypothetical protein